MESREPWSQLRLAVTRAHSGPYLVTLVERTGQGNYRWDRRIATLHLRRPESALAAEDVRTVLRAAIEALEEAAP